MVYRSLLGYFSSESTMFTSLPPRRLRWSAGAAAGAAGRSSLNHVPAPHSGMSLLVLPKGVGVRVALPGQRQICGSSFSKEKENSLWLECPDANGPGLLRAGPSGGERCTPQCPQEISLLTLPVFQGAAVSSERFSRSLPPRNVAELGGSPPLRGSLEQLDWPSPAGSQLQGTELAALSRPEASLESLVPLVGRLALWEPLPSVSHWVLLEQTLVL